MNCKTSLPDERSKQAYRIVKQASRYILMDNESNCNFPSTEMIMQYVLSSNATSCQMMASNIAYPKPSVNTLTFIIMYCKIVATNVMISKFDSWLTPKL